ncbi:hypothetical protein EB796_024382 [Bugula neritina]|uniref:Uncharacterized protein n=1 Tax=Bugula neritina TaxID=10212 RepID=A0A7J7IU35_BUGNE|nr:hypothetical protein EB796_024382 [Bugula neritina]
MPEGLGDSAQGFFNCVVFIFTTPHVRDKLPCRRFKIKFKRSQDNHRSNLSHEDIITSSSKHSSNDDTPPTPNYGSMKQHGNSSSSHTVGISGDGVTYSCSPKDSKS